jgi:1-acyl-sn-glycerol-3-phosphate acyltransferase
MQSRKSKDRLATRPPRLDAYPVNAFIRLLFRVSCRLDPYAFRGLPETGPGIIVMNHINFLEAPLLASFLFPRPLAALTKKENLEIPGYGYLGKLWNAIPIDRGAVDTESFKHCLDWMESGGILGLAPEGTRSRNGVLGRGKPGVAMLAYRAGVPIWPIAHWGGELFWSRLKAFKKTPLSVQTGVPFIIEPVGSMTKTVRQEVADEIMDRIAALLPERYRGGYAQTCFNPPRHTKPLAGFPS